MGLLILFLFAQQEDQGTPDPLRQPETKPDLEWTFRGGTRFGYIDNVIRMSPADIAQFEDGTKPEKYRIRQVEDFIYEPWAEASAEWLLLGHPVTAGLRAAHHGYFVNTFLHYQELGGFFEVKPFELAYTFRPKVYRREYKNLETDEFESAYYADHELALSARFSIVEKLLDLRPQAALYWRNYDAPFDFRDQFHVLLGLRLRYRPFEIVELGLGYQFDNCSSSASSLEPDTSYAEHRIEPEVAFHPFDPLEVGLRYRFAHQTYTTNNDPDVDPGHRGRIDREQRFTLFAVYKFSRHFSIDGEYRHTRVATDSPNDADATDEDSNWRRNELTLGLSVRF